MNKKTISALRAGIEYNRKAVQHYKSWLTCLEMAEGVYKTIQQATEASTDKVDKLINAELKQLLFGDYQQATVSLIRIQRGLFTIER